MRSSTATRNADALAERQERIKALTEKLENGVKAVFASEDYARYLEAMSKFHHYSFGNCLLIYFQCPEAQAVAGYTTWKKLGRSVKKGEKGIQILAPCPQKILMEQDKLDAQGNAVIGPDGQPEKESAIIKRQRFNFSCCRSPQPRADPLSGGASIQRLLQSLGAMYLRQRGNEPGADIKDADP